MKWPNGMRRHLNPRRLDGIKKIAVLRANALGDFIFALPALDAIRHVYLDAEITLLGKQWHVDFLQERPGPIDRVVPVPYYQGVNEAGNQHENLEEQNRFFSEMQAEHYDLALQMHGGGRNSNPFILRLGARFTAGMKTADAPALDRWIPYVYWQHEALRLLEVAGLVGARPVDLESRLSVTQRDIQESCAALPEESPPLAVIHPGASDPRRRWPAERFAVVGDALVQSGCRVAIVGIAEEHTIAREVITGMHQPAIDLCGALSLHALTGIISRARLVVANDSGPRHLAEAVGTPTVGIYWCGNLINAGSLYRSYHRPHLSWRLDCPICGKNTIHDRCEHNPSFVDDVQVDEVIASALDLLEIGNAAHA